MPRLPVESLPRIENPLAWSGWLMRDALAAAGAVPTTPFPPQPHSRG